ncbi:tRNA (cytidine/uridine-2'-O-)-methyltransferase [Thermotomaculum hydrothermale]|uniref:Putative tRNA (cytidine(34)-2'-O)-methyltransferase n=1 Tax=Thermotomaculum hydrothermale TaxID=981385 RepID=A0A7R6PWT3_9BACT|nr:tRNA (cytidine(34)-2'-O)-methyltransferase [Thermotomaculum hydrothermale]BBB32090.1 tRNA (cytidine/uridine-2'-O-)-methyltransferase [Thermotomaculum hydrothermale]
MFNIVLYEPEIPQNTGNIGRLCVGLNAVLHLIEPLGFSLEDKYMKRAGLDYWKYLDLKIYKNFDEFLKKNNPERIFYFSKKVEKPYWEGRFEKGDFLVFGKETMGLPEKIVFNPENKVYKIPMVGKTRSLNLSNSVAIVAYEAFRQVSLRG